MVGVEAFTDVVKTRESVKLEQFTKALPSGVHRWVIDHKPGDLTAQLGLQMSMQFFPIRFKHKRQIIRQVPTIMLGKENPLGISTAEPLKSHLLIGIVPRVTA